MKEQWQRAIRELDIDLSKTPIRITADELRSVTDKDPRLLLYIDSFEALPSIFRENDIFPVPIENGVYLLVKGRGYQELEDGLEKVPLIVMDSENIPETLKEGSGEDKYLLIALHSGIISHFVGTDDLELTSFGRKRSSSFVYRVGSTKMIEVKGIQIQVDFLLETKTEIIIIEAKAKEPKSFSIRQLYYPFRDWRPS